MGKKSSQFDLKQTNKTEVQNLNKHKQKFRHEQERYEVWVSAGKDPSVSILSY